MRGLIDHVNKSTRESEKKFADKALKAEEARKHKKNEFYDLDLEASKLYKEYAKIFCDSTLKYINSNFPKEERDLALAAIFWQYFD